jgi:cell division protease FtsH
MPVPPSPRAQPPRNNDDRPTPWRVEGERKPPSGEGGRQGPSRAPFGRRWIYLIVGLLALNIVIAQIATPRTERIEVPYTFFRSQVTQNNVIEVNSKGETIQGKFRKAASPARDVKANVNFKTQRPAFANDSLFTLLEQHNVRVNAEPVDQGPGLLATILIYFGPTLLLVAFFVWIARRTAAAGGAGGLTGLGRSRARRYEPSEQRVTFDDVEGIDEAEDELVEIVDFLKNPDRYRKLGAAIPKGVLLSGPPGTGKTLLARAVAGEANVPFFSLSASEFIEMVVGVGASRVRDLFDQAKKTAPAIIFIDELDAIGRQRGSSSFGGSDEREQTLNQILTEMDGFTGTEGVIVIAATNRPEILDPALLRPGRFDRRVVVNPPDRDGRAKILKVHTRSVPLADEVDIDTLASNTPGMVGADLRNLVNEAALTAARRGHDRVLMADFTDALEKIILGAERRITISPDERERTAYHESGHAVLGMLEPGADPVRKVSIVPRGRALGVTFQSPETDRYGYDQRYLRGRIVGALGGRAAEQIIYGNVTTGAESDLEQVTRIARQMVGRWGMSERIGLVTVLPGPADEPLLFPGTNGGPSEETRQIVDEEVRKIVEDCYDRAVRLLGENRERLDGLAQALLEHETLDEQDAYKAAGFDRKPPAAEIGEEGAVGGTTPPAVS